MLRRLRVLLLVVLVGVLLGVVIGGLPVAHHDVPLRVTPTSTSVP